MCKFSDFNTLFQELLCLREFFFLAEERQELAICLLFKFYDNGKVVSKDRLAKDRSKEL